MQIKKQLIKRTIDGDTLLVPVGRTVYDANGLFVLNELGAFLWDLLPQAGDARDLLRAVLEEYEVSEQEALADIEEFLARLREMKIL